MNVLKSVGRWMKNRTKTVSGEPWIQPGTISSVGDAIACAHVKSLKQAIIYTLFDYNIKLFKLVMKFLYSSVIVC